MDELEQIYQLVKNDFCAITTYKKHKGYIEIITPFATTHNKFVSVFIKKIDDKYVISDAGWTDLNIYDIDISEGNEQFVDKVILHYKSSFGVSSTIDSNNGTVHYYKSCFSVSDIPSLAYDLASFITGVVNAQAVRYKDEKEEREKETFRNDANNFLEVKYPQSVSLRTSLYDLPGVKFNAVITKQSRLHLITYITGSTPYYFQNDLRKSIVNFELADKSNYKSHIQNKISILNDKAVGYVPEKMAGMFELLNDKSTTPPIVWSQKESILQVI